MAAPGTAVSPVPADRQNGDRVAGGDRFVFWDAANFPEVVPNVAKGWEVSEDGTQITLFLREGPSGRTANRSPSADMMFWYEYVYQNEELVPVHRRSSTSHEGATLEAPDDYTLVFTFPFANSLFLEVLGSSVDVYGGLAFSATGNWRISTCTLHAAVPSRLRGCRPNWTHLSQEEGFDNWVNLFKDKNTWQRNPESAGHDTVEDGQSHHHRHMGAGTQSLLFRCGYRGQPTALHRPHLHVAGRGPGSV